jgi:hypothetical protein
MSAIRSSSSFFFALLYFSSLRLRRMDSKKYTKAHKKINNANKSSVATRVIEYLFCPLSYILFFLTSQNTCTIQSGKMMIAARYIIDEDFVHENEG